MLNGLNAKEHEIMKFLWDNEEGVTFGEVHAYINGLGKEIKRQSAYSYVQNLIDKGYVNTEGKDRRKLYFPRIPKKQYESMMAKNVVEQLFDGSLKKFVSALTGNQELTDQEIKELKAILKKRG